MKRIYISLFVVVSSILASCQVIQTQDSTLSEDTEKDVKYFTATIGSETKITLDFEPTRGVYKTVWSENDVVKVIDAETGEYEICPIVEGVGTNSAKFAGTIDADKYYAVYGESYGYMDSTMPTVYLSSHQSNETESIWDENTNDYRYETNLNGDFFPMFAQSSSKSFSFQNLCSILKINVTGDDGDNLYSVRMIPGDENIFTSGEAHIEINDGEPVLKFLYGENILNVQTYQHLSSDPSSVYMVLPPQTYKGGFTIEFELSSGVKTLTVEDDIVMRRSRIRNMNVNLAENTYAEPENWGLYVTADGGESWRNYDLTKDGDMYVYKGVYVSANTDLYIRDNDEGTYYGCSRVYLTNTNKTNSRINLVPSEDGMSFNMTHAGYYDIYLDSVNDCVFIMSEDCSPYELPTMNTVLYDSYDSLEEASDGGLAKVHGVVMAKNKFASILALDGKYYNNVMVYDPTDRLGLKLGCWVDLYAGIQTYNGRKELVVDEASWYRKIIDQEKDYDPEDAVMVEDPTAYASDDYEYVTVVGTLHKLEEKNKIHYSLIVSGSEGHPVLLSQPLKNLDEYEGKQVVVGGYYMGPYTSETTSGIKLMYKRVWDYGDTSKDSTTEDVMPGGTITVTNN